MSTNLHNLNRLLACRSALALPRTTKGKATPIQVPKQNIESCQNLLELLFKEELPASVVKPLNLAAGHLKNQNTSAAFNEFENAVKLFKAATGLGVAIQAPPAEPEDKNANGAAAG